MNIDRRVVRVGLASSIAAGAAWALLNQDNIDLPAIEGALQGLGAWAPAVFIASFALATVLLVPGSLFGLAGGILFGPLWGTVWNLLGGTIGAAIAFFLARYVAGDWVSKKLGGHLKTIVESAEAEGWRFVALMRLLPIVPFNLLNYGLGLTRIGFAHYLLATVVCMIPGTAAYAWLGHAGRAAISGSADALRYAFLGIGLLAAVVFLPRLVRRITGRATAWITAEQLRQQLAADAPVIVIDVREPDELIGPLGHIPVAFNIPLSRLPARVVEIASYGATPKVIVCKTDKRSAKAALALRAAGAKDVFVLRGGMEQWNGAAGAS